MVAYDVLKLEAPADLYAGVTGHRRDWRILMYYYFVATPRIDPDLVEQIYLFLLKTYESELPAGIFRPLKTSRQSPLQSPRPDASHPWKTRRA